MQAPLSLAYLRETAGDFADPQHAHSFARTADGASLAARGRLLLRDCALCRQRALALSGVGRRPRDTVCACLRCGALVHRACLSLAHLHRGRESVLPLCPARSSTSTSPSLLPSTKSKSAPPRLFGNEHLPSTFTLATLIEELGRDPSAVAARTTVAKQLPPATPAAKSAAVAKRVAPLLAAGGVLGALALGPIGGVVAGLNVLVTTVGMEALAAGVGLTAATAAAATVSRQHKARRAKRKLERLRSGAWAMEICWRCKSARQGELSDDAFRKDAEFLRRFQAAAVVEDGVDTTTGVPSADEVFGFLFSIFSSSSEFLSQANVQLCAAFRERYHARLAARTNDSTSSSNTTSSSSILRDTLQDTKMYIAHITGATMQSFPSLASTEQALAACAEAIERIVYDDIHSIVFREFELAFTDADVLFHENLDRIRKEQRDHHPSASLLFTPPTTPGEKWVLHEHLQAAEQTLTTMIHRTCSPLRKLKLLCSAFRSICYFADQLHQTASNADILIPIVCSLLVASPQLMHETDAAGSEVARRNFVSEIAFISFFTNGGGKGAEGYVLTTFQAVVQVIAAVDLSNGPARELELFMEEEQDMDDEEDTEEEDEFFDAATES